MEMDFENVFKNTSDNYDEVRDWTSTPSKQASRAFPISSTVSSVIYYKRIETNNNLEGNVEMKPIEMTQLLYVTLREQVNQVSMVADFYNNMMSQCVPIEGLALNSSSTSSPSCVDDNNVISI